MENGRPTKYRAVFAEQARKLCDLGATDAQLADFFGVCETTINTWKQEHPKFLASIKEAKECSDEEVVRALRKRAIGCSVPDSDVRVVNGELTVTPLRKHYPPETAACMAWLHNRQPGRWRPRMAEPTPPPEEDEAPDDYFL